MKTAVEVRSATWQKIFISLLFLPCVGIAVVGWLSPFVPAFRAGASSTLQPIILGSFFFVGGFGIWWPVMRYSIRADDEGITQTNGFFRQSVRWSEVAYYYMEPNKRYHKERRFHVEPVMCNAEGAIVFRGFAHILISTGKVIEQRRRLWQFVEAQLEGKKVQAPSADLDPETIAVRSLEVKWSEKTWVWKLARILGLVCYALFWLGFTMLPLYYALSKGITIPKPWGLLLISLTFFGPILPHIIWLEIKKRKIAKQLKINPSRRL